MGAHHFCKHHFPRLDKDHLLLCTFGASSPFSPPKYLGRWLQPTSFWLFKKLISFSIGCFLVIYSDKCPPMHAIRWVTGYLLLLPWVFSTSVFIPSLTFKYFHLALEPEMAHNLQTLLLCLAYLRKT